MKLDMYLLLCQKSKPKCAKDLNVKPKTLKLIGENTGSTLQYLDVRNFISIGIGKDFLKNT